MNLRVPDESTELNTYNWQEHTKPAISDDVFDMQKLYALRLVTDGENNAVLCCGAHMFSENERCAMQN